MDYSAQQNSNQLAGGESSSVAKPSPTYRFAKIAERLIAEGNFDEAYDLLQSGITAFPDYTSGYQVMGDLYVARKNYVAATFAYFEALRREPDNPLTLMKLGDLFKAEGQIDESRKYYLQAAQLEPDSQTVAERLRAIGFFESEAPEMEHEILVTETAADLFRLQGYFEKAKAIYLRLLKDSPSDQHLYDKLKLCG